MSNCDLSREETDEGTIQFRKKNNSWGFWDSQVTEGQAPTYEYQINGWRCDKLFL